MLDFTIRTKQDLIDAVERFGILPLFRNPLPGFSVEEHADPSVWFSEDPGVWEWKGPVIRETGCAYGKFLGNKAVFISRDWFPDFANWRRDGYDFDARFDDELAPYRDKVLYDLLDRMAPVLSRDLKKEGGYNKKENTGFDTIVTRLQTQCYILTSDFVYMKDKHGQPYGWGVAEYSTPERFMGTAFTDRVYQCEPEESYRKILSYIMSLVPGQDQKTVEKFLRSTAGPVRESGRRLWLVPSNPKYFDIIRAFRERDEIEWKQGNDNIRPGDIAYMYLGLPYSAILYRCEVTETDIPYFGKSEHVNLKKLMKIRKLQEYPRDFATLHKMKAYNVTTVRSARFMPEDLAADLDLGKLRAEEPGKK